jgi:hypothetical protein
LFDGLPNAADLVRRQIIHHYDIAGGEFGNEHLLDVSSERLAVHRSVEHHGSGDAGEPETSG